MKRKALIAAVLTLTSISATAAEQRGAKAIFVDTTSGAVVERSNPQTSTGSRPAQRPRRPTTPAAAAATTMPEAIGIMYYIELVAPSGERSLVTVDRNFRSGDRILLHVKSNVDSDVAVYQREPDGRQTRLFPDSRINDGSALIKKGEDTVLPSPTAWFRFDDQTGIEHLTIILTPRTAGASPPWRTAPPTLSASHDATRPGAGSKGLIVETDTTSAQPATYAMSRIENGRVSGPVEISVTLKHQ